MDSLLDNAIRYQMSHEMRQMADAPLVARGKRRGPNVVLARIGLVCVTAICLISGCSGHAPTYSKPGQTPSESTPYPPSATATRGGEMQAPTARGVVDELVKLGFETPNPQDTTAQDCPAAGCDQSIVTDVFRVESFPTTGRAEIYAKDRGLDQDETIVVSFAPPVPQAEQDRYWAQIEKIVG